MPTSTQSPRSATPPATPHGGAHHGPPGQVDLTPVLARLDAMAAQLGYLADRQHKQAEMIAEFTPIARLALDHAITRFAALEQDGTVAFLRELAAVGQRIMTGFSPDDVRQLGDAVVGILQTVRAMTQPEVMAIAADATSAMVDADAVKPLGLFGMVRATKDDDVQKGMAILLEVLRRVGRGAGALADKRQASDTRKARLAELLGPRRKQLGIERPRLPAGPRPTPAARPAHGGAAAPAPRPAGGGPACAVPSGPAPVATVIDGIAYGADGHLVDASAWTRPLAEAIAQLQGQALTDAHWAIIDTARADFAATGASPNIRRLTQVAGVSTKDLYTLFPKAPARTIAKIAGLPKPAGCL